MRLILKRHLSAFKSLHNSLTQRLCFVKSFFTTYCVSLSEHVLSSKQNLFFFNHIPRDWYKSNATGSLLATFSPQKLVQWLINEGLVCTNCTMDQTDQNCLFGPILVENPKLTSFQLGGINISLHWNGTIKIKTSKYIHTHLKNNFHYFNHTNKKNIEFN